MKSKLKETKSRMFLLKLEENGIDSSKKHLEIPPQRLRNILEIEKDQLEDWINSQGNQKTLKFKDKINNECLLNIVNSCQKLKLEQNNVTFYKHPMIQQRDLKDQSILKTLVVIGETGVGKSTMINFSAITILDSNMQIHLDLQLLMKNKYNNYIKGLDGNSASKNN
ncbi:unnamed protein product [Paramecium octaurelia]|uniref:Uncharacterized protein n=1 Tax=Paramecium octaurelia TaxID=43137 RepID=A0A8S1XU45_PAROT|nr:unnamed protein product [Paramecium octaurelia]